jgi:hypothetical protein
MTDPERISKRSTGLAAQLLQAGAEEWPSEAGVEQTLAALGVSGAILTTTTATSAASAAASGAKLTSAATAGAGAAGGGIAATAASGTVKAVSAMVLVKWIGIGVVGGVGLAGAAAVATAPSTAVHAPMKAAVSAAAPVVTVAAAAVVEPAAPSVVAEAPAAEATPVAAAPAPRVSVVEPAAAAPVLEVGAPLAAEVAFVDRARSLLGAGQTEQGLAMLSAYEREFPEARLLPEVLFLKLETLDRLGRRGEARAAAQRLLEGFPKSPHASRARKILDQ